MVSRRCLSSDSGIESRCSIGSAISTSNFVTIQKLVFAVNMQLMVMAGDPDKAQAFEKAARQIIIDLLGPCERELYALCDAVEALPVQAVCND